MGGIITFKQEKCGTVPITCIHECIYKQGIIFIQYVEVYEQKRALENAYKTNKAIPLVPNFINFWMAKQRGFPFAPKHTASPQCNDNITIL